MITKIEQLQKANTTKIVFQPQSSDIATFEAFCEAAYKASNCMVLIDEVHLWATPHQLPSALKKLIVMGAKRGIGMMLISQRPALTNTTCISQSSHIICFTLFLDADVEYFRSFLGSAADKLHTLPLYSYIHCDMGEHKIYVRDGNGKVLGMQEA